MDLRETQTGSGPRDFPTTRWSAILSLGEASPEDYRRQMDALLRTYWRPVFVYVRAAWGATVEDAKDLTQGFFTYLLSKQYLSRLRHESGTFRGYLKRSLNHFLIDRKRARTAHDPKSALLSLDAPLHELASLGPAGKEETPEEAYDRQWFSGVLEEAIDTLRKRLAADGKGVYYEVFRRYCGPQEGEGGEDSPTYEQLAAQLGITRTDVRCYLEYSRDFLRQILRDRIREYAASDAEIDPELDCLLRGRKRIRQP